MALMRFDPFRELDRLAEQALAGARPARSLSMEAVRRGDQFIVAPAVERNVIEIAARRRPLRQERDPNNMSATCDHGVLTSTVTVSVQSKPRKVEADTADGAQQATGTESASPQTVHA